MRSNHRLTPPLGTTSDRPIYLDHHATTPVDPRVLRKMLPYFSEKFGNASSGSHSFGRDALKAVQIARTEAAKLIHASSEEIIFTSGATEANNLALKGAAHALKGKGRHIVTLATEHKSVLDPLKRLEMDGFEITRLPVDGEGFVSMEMFEKSLRSDTILVSVMWANNETGVIQPIQKLARLTQNKSILFHTDAVQGAAYCVMDMRKTAVDLLTFTAHKIYGPKGAGALYIRKREPNIRLLPLLDGGGQEKGLRSGTLNIPALVGFGEACRLCRTTRKNEIKRVGRLRDCLKNGLAQKVRSFRVNGSEKARLPNNLNISFKGVRSADLFDRLPDIALSSGSACLSTSPEPSHVLKAMGVEEGFRWGAVRFGLGRFTPQKDIDRVIARFASVLPRKGK